MTKAQTIHCADAPDNTGLNAGHFSQAVRIGDTIYIGGTLAIDQHAQKVVDEDAEAAMHRAFANLEAICGAAGAALGDIVMLTALLTDLGDLDALNAVQARFFRPPHPPRSTLQVAGLPHGRIELTAIAVVGCGPAAAAIPGVTPPASAAAPPA